MPLYLLSGVIFPVSRLPEDVLHWLLWNPLLHFTELIRYAHFDHYPMAVGTSWTYILSVSLTILFTGMWLYRARRLELIAQ